MNTRETGPNFTAPFHISAELLRGHGVSASLRQSVCIRYRSEARASIHHVDLGAPPTPAAPSGRSARNTGAVDPSAVETRRDGDGAQLLACQPYLGGLSSDGDIVRQSAAANYAIWPIKASVTDDGTAGIETFKPIPLKCADSCLCAYAVWQ